MPKMHWTSKLRLPVNKTLYLGWIMSKSHILTLDIEIYNTGIKDTWPQGKYLVHGYDDVFWSDDLNEAMSFLKQSILDGEKNEI